MLGRIPSNVYLRPDDLSLLERVFVRTIPEHDTHSEEFSMLLTRLFHDGMRDERKLIAAAEKRFR